MPLLDFFPHRATAKIRTRKLGRLAGAKDEYTTVLAGVKCWRNTLSARARIQYEQREVQITDRIFFKTRPDINEQHILIITSAVDETEEAVTLEVRTRPIQHDIKGRGVHWVVDCEQVHYSFAQADAPEAEPEDPIWPDGFALYEMIREGGLEGAPDFQDFGIRRAVQLTSWFLHEGGGDAAYPVSQARINDKVPTYLADTLNLGDEIPRTPIIIDIQHFVHQLDFDPDLSNIRNALDWVREAIEGIGYTPQISAFGFPTYGFSDVASGSTSSWQATNETAMGLLVPHMDFIHPPLYMLDPADDPDNSATNFSLFAAEMIDLARSLSSGKRVIPFIWPMYHPSSTGGSGPWSEISGTVWRTRVLDFCKDNCDAAILYLVSDGHIFDEDLTWWTETKDFLADIGAYTP